MPPVAEASISERDLGLAEQLVEAMAEDWDPDAHEDVYQKRLEELIEAKSAGRTVRHAEERPAREGTVVELTDALRRTLKERKGGRARAPEPRRSEESGKGRTAEKGHTAGKGAAKGSGRSKRKAGPARPDLEGLTKKELLDRARELDVPGRSKMSREDLESAVRERLSA
jgi:DNA end-binding protein Ku